MGKNYLVDTNTLIEYIGDLLPLDAHAFVGEVIENNFYVSIINRIEILGHESSNQRLRDFMDLADTFPLSDQIAEQTFALRKFKKMKLPDAIIAATALVNGLKIISRNTNDFQNIPGLDFINPYDL